MKKVSEKRYPNPKDFHFDNLDPKNFVLYIILIVLFGLVYCLISYRYRELKKQLKTIFLEDGIVSYYDFISYNNYFMHMIYPHSSYVVKGMICLKRKRKMLVTNYFKNCQCDKLHKLLIYDKCLLIGKKVILTIYLNENQQKFVIIIFRENIIKQFVTIILLKIKIKNNNR